MSTKTVYKTLAPFFDAVDASEEKALKFKADGYMGPVHRGPGLQ